MPSFPRKKAKKKGFIFIPHKHPIVRAQTRVSTHTRRHALHTHALCLHLLGMKLYHNLYSWQWTKTNLTSLFLDRSTLPDFSDKGGEKTKKSERMDTQCTYLTQKYKTTGPDFLGKSCSKTLRSSWSQFKCPLRKRETSGLGLWVLPEFLGTKVYVLQNMPDHR